jgi:hypothetical protein
MQLGARLVKADRLAASDLLAGDLSDERRQARIECKPALTTRRAVLLAGELCASTGLRLVGVGAGRGRPLVAARSQAPAAAKPPPLKT